MQFERLRKNHKRKIIIGGLILVCVISAITITTTRAKYKLTQNIKLAEGNVNYKTPDLNMVAVYQGEGTSDTDYTAVETVPTSGYTLNSTRSYCAVGGTKDATIGIAYSGGKVTISNLVRKGTKCYLYFDTIKDTTKPTISNVTTSVTKTEINVTVSASDDKGVTEYWYQIGTSAAVKKTTSSHSFTGLSAGTTYTIKVYVKDAAGNQSDTTTKSVTTSEPSTISTIISNSNYKTITPTFSNIAESDEGVYRVSDGMYGGYSYYWRGAATTNHVIFANKCWRIIRINGDNTMRLIYNGLVSNGTCSGNGANNESVTGSVMFYFLDNTYSWSVGWTYERNLQRPSNNLTAERSAAKVNTDAWYNNNIGNNSTYASKIADGKYCNDRNTGTGGKTTSWSATGNDFYYAALTRVVSASPTLSCPNGDIYTLKVGLISADEVIYAGGKLITDNTSYYLYNGQKYFTMSPSIWNSQKTAAIVTVDSSGSLISEGRARIRPVINLRSDVTFSNGNGTQSNPYVVQ